MGLFSRKKLLASNAPRHWPPVEVSGLDAEDPAQRAAAVLASLLEGFQAKGLSAQPVAALQHRMFPEGIVEVSLEIEEAGKRFPIFIYPEATPEAAGHYAAARQFLREKAGQTALYYCPTPIQPAKPTNAWETLDTRMFFNLDEEDAVPEGEAALWWATEAQPRFSDAPALQHVTAAYEAFDRIEPWLFMAYCNDLQLTPQPPQGPVALPDEELVHPVHGPDGQLLFLCASAEKGISFAFPISTTPVEYRDLFLSHYAAFCQKFAADLKEHGVTPLLEGDETPCAWWKFMISVAQQKESEGGAVAKIGTIGVA